MECMFLGGGLEEPRHQRLCALLWRPCPFLPESWYCIKTQILSLFQRDVGSIRSRKLHPSVCIILGAWQKLAFWRLVGSREVSTGYCCTVCAFCTHEMWSASSRPSPESVAWSSNFIEGLFLSWYSTVHQGLQGWLEIYRHFYCLLWVLYALQIPAREPFLQIVHCWFACALQGNAGTVSSTISTDHDYLTCLNYHLTIIASPNIYIFIYKYIYLFIYIYLYIFFYIYMWKLLIQYNNKY